MELDENSTITIPIRNLIAIILGVAVAVIGYFEVTNRIGIVERDMMLLRQQVEPNSNFRIEWAPPPEVQATVKLSHENKVRMEYLERKVTELELELNNDG
jgi:hypothetical protein